MAKKVRFLSDAEIIVGSYEEFLLGYKICKTEDKKYSLSNSFANHSHQASVRCCASSSQFIASGGADETIHLYNMNTRREHGSLVHQNGTITYLGFYGQTHMFSASEDGSLCVWRVGSWECTKVLKGHRGPITSVSIHPSGKLALSVGRDRTLRTWNLVKGRSAYVTNLAPLKSEKAGMDIGAEEVRWSTLGSRYAVMYRTKVDVYDVSIAGIVYSLDFGGSRISCIYFASDDILIAGGEGGVIEFHNPVEKKKILRWKAYSEDDRVRCIECITVEGDENRTILVSSSSSGLVKLWKINLNKMGKEPECVGEVNASCRVTCLTVHVQDPGLKRKNNKKGQTEEIVKLEEDEEEKEEDKDEDTCDEKSEEKLMKIQSEEEESSSVKKEKPSHRDKSVLQRKKLRKKKMKAN
ncbi:hypothetical protein J437_LFUL015054 [Ladona fulva]|uniref:P21-activated protein kinase-interacting protein 1-like n=1 Tax=Ladona fulva TaxID=123851 RepID=A0A8K0K5S6_LADFU|nr:hypothetical protein J437_LFUL015054 [Ladona fulva]